MGLALAYAGHTDQGAEQILKTLELDPDFALAYYHLGTVYSVGARLDRAVEAFESADRKSAASLGPGRLGCAYASPGAAKTPFGLCNAWSRAAVMSRRSNLRTCMPA